MEYQARLQLTLSSWVRDPESNEGKCVLIFLRKDVQLPFVPVPGMKLYDGHDEYTVEEVSYDLTEHVLNVDVGELEIAFSEDIDKVVAFYKQQGWHADDSDCFEFPMADADEPVVTTRR
ncbi:MAG: hypothetical protein DRN68_08595 [Thaumarchaeota archaeon]|nr:MAG: hypothetical protein DRN68_08595 [Nitrososphaerota archaeon]